MSIQLPTSTEPLELYFWWEEPRGRRVASPHLFDARRLVARLARKGQGQALRRLAAAHQPVIALEDRELFDLVSRWIAAGTLRLAAVPVAPLLSRAEAAEEVAQAALPWIAPPVVLEEPAPVEEEEAVPPELVEMAVQARALREAAKLGIAFCEECEKPRRRPATPPPEAEADDVARLDQSAQADTLKHAARHGVPFCEECARSTRGAVLSR